LSYSPTVNYCIRCYVIAKALSFLVCGIAAILKRGYIDAAHNLFNGFRRGDSILFITLYFAAGSGISGQHSWCISSHPRPS